MMRRGWYGQSARHSLAARGVRTNSPYLKAKRVQEYSKKKESDFIKVGTETYFKDDEGQYVNVKNVNDVLDPDSDDGYRMARMFELSGGVPWEAADAVRLGLGSGSPRPVYAKKKVKITAEPHEEGRAYPMTKEDVHQVMENQGDAVNGITRVSFEDPKNAEEQDAWARYKRGKREIVVFSQPKEEINGEVNKMMREHVVPHEVGHHVALYKRKITDKNLEVAEARADAHAAGFDVEDRDIHKFRQDMGGPTYAKAKEFDFKNIQGEWVQKSVKGNPPFQKGCTDVRAKYTPQKDGSIKVENTCKVNGKKRSIIGKAKKVGNKELSVDFFPGIPFTSGEYKVKKYSGDKMTVQGGKYEWELERKTKRRSYNYTPTYAAGDLPLIAADGAGTAGAATVALLPLVVTAGAVYVGAKVVKNSVDKTKKVKKKRKLKK